MIEKYLLVQARMGSKRLPGKMLMTVDGKSIIDILLARLARLSSYKIIVLTSNLEIDNVLAEYCEDKGYTVYRGDEANVYRRFKEFVKERVVPNSILVRLTGDNVLINLDLIKSVVNFHVDSGVMFTSTREILEDKRVIRYLPKGQSVDVFNSNIFDFISENNLDSFDKEHVIPCFYRYVDYVIYKPDKDLMLPSVSIDEIEDLETLKTYLK